MTVLVVAEHLVGEVRDVTYELISAARELEQRVAVAVIADDPSALDLARVGVDEVIHVRVQQDAFDNDAYQRALEALIAERSPTVVLAGFTVNSMGFVPAVAAKLTLGFASDVFALRREADRLLATRAFYGGRVHAELEFPVERPIALLLRPTVWSQAVSGGSPQVSELIVAEGVSRTRHLGFQEAKADDVDISSAEFLLCIGRGIGDEENVAMFEHLATKFGAVLSSSRPLVDAGWLASSRLVGQSGKTVKPKVYLAFGISGAVQHLAGIKGSGTIIAVNKDPDAAIFGVAHFGAVADLFEVANEIEKLV
jgi:electron transfer flavoprotein alpha subunit